MKPIIAAMPTAIQAIVVLFITAINKFFYDRFERPWAFFCRRLFDSLHINQFEAQAPEQGIKLVCAIEGFFRFGALSVRAKLCSHFDEPHRRGEQMLRDAPRFSLMPVNEFSE